MSHDPAQAFEPVPSDPRPRRRRSNANGLDDSQPHENASPIGVFSFESASRWVGRDPKPIQFVVADLIPRGMVTILSADGGAGKTIAAQTAMTCVGAGLPLFGQASVQGSAVGLFAEDPEDVLHLRQNRICRNLGVDLENIGADVFPRSFAGQPITLYDRNGPTEAMAQLERSLGRHQNLALAVLDNSALLFDEDENDRIKVTRFMGYLNAMAMRLDAALLLNAHTSKSSDDSAGRAASGSTAWIWAARSALKLSPATKTEPARLKLVKANHTQPGLEIALKWQKGVLTRVDAPDELSQRLHRQKLDKLILDTIEGAWRDDNPFSNTAQTGGRYLPRHLSASGEFAIEEVKLALATMLDNGVVVVSQRTSRTPKGLKLRNQTSGELV